MAGDLLPKKVNIKTSRNDDFPIEFTLTEDGSGKNIAGYSFLMTVTTLPRPEDDTTEVFQSIGTITGAASGVVEFPRTTADAAIAADTYFYDVEGTDPAGKKRTYVEGRYLVQEDRTK